MKEKNSRFLIAATSSGSGKTTLTLGLLRAMKKRGLACQPFKCGPDYIDTMFHTLAAGFPSVNLDEFLSSGGHVQHLYAKYAGDKDVCIAEGVMGLFDGYNKAEGSSAAVAELLDMPVILVLNAKSMAYSAAAMLYGFKNFSKKLNVVGVIFNFVSSDSHYRFLKEACDDAGLVSLGYLPENTGLKVPSRHLGLSIDKDFLFDELADKTADFIEKYIDIDLLLKITAEDVPVLPAEVKNNRQGNLRVAIARDEAFCFMYHENIEYLKRIGSVSFFSPLKDERLPDADFVYLPGGYPELFLPELSANKTMLASIAQYVEAGGRLLAECGGMMYLSETVADKDGMAYPMVGVLRQQATMANMKLKLGYRKFVYNDGDFKGHEFHYSTINSDLQSMVQQYNARNQPVDTKLIRYKNVIAGYTHLYWAETGNIMDLFN